MSEQTAIDGRSARRDRNQEAVIEAAIDLINEGNASPGVTEIAERAGVSYRSVFRYFPDRDDVISAALSRACDRMEEASKADAKDFVAARVELWETFAPVAQALRVGAASSDALDARLVEHRKLLRSQVKSNYKTQLAKLAKADQPAALAAIEIATGYEGYNVLRVGSRMSKPKTVAAAERLVKQSLKK